MLQPPTEGLWAGTRAAWGRVGPPRARGTPGSAAGRPWSRDGRSDRRPSQECAPATWVCWPLRSSDDFSSCSGGPLSLSKPGDAAAQQTDSRRSATFRCMLCAPRAPHHPALDPRRRRERFGRRASGSPADPAAKAKRDRSMPRTQEGSEGVYGLVLQDPRDRVRATLHEASSPGMHASILRHNVYRRSHCDRAAEGSPSEPSAQRTGEHDSP